MNCQSVRKRDKTIQNLTHIQKFKFIYFFLFLHILIGLYIGFAYKYGEHTAPEHSSFFSEITQENVKKLYPFFQDVHVMVFVGFGFLMTFLNSYSWSSVSFNLMLGAFSIEIGLIFLHFWHCVFNNHFTAMEIDVTMLIRADFVAATVLITYGAVIGKFNMVQYLMMAFIEIFFITLCSTLGETVFKAVDSGGSMYIHMFGAYFGLALVMACKYNKANDHFLHHSHYNSNLFAMIGTIFLYMYWPSFNSALTSGNGQQRIITNTVLSLTSSVMAVFLITPFFKKGKLWMDNVLNSTVAGGVIIGASADLIPNPFIAIILGFFGGVLSSVGFEYLAPWLKKKINLQDTAGIHNLHGMPGFFAGIIGIIVIASQSSKRFSENVGQYFEIESGRTSGEQAGYQAAALFTTLGVSLISGYLTGLYLDRHFFNKVLEQDIFEDKNCWDMDHMEVEHKKELELMKQLRIGLGEKQLKKQTRKLSDNLSMEFNLLKNKKNTEGDEEDKKPLNQRKNFELVKD